jgi:hypothetical protein
MVAKVEAFLIVGVVDAEREACLDLLGVVLRPEAERDGQPFQADEMEAEKSEGPTGPILELALGEVDIFLPAADDAAGRKLLAAVFPWAQPDLGHAIS